MSASKIVHTGFGAGDTFVGFTSNGDSTGSLKFDFGDEGGGKFKVKIGEDDGGGLKLGFIDPPSTGGKPLTFGFGSKGGGGV